MRKTILFGLAAAMLVAACSEEDDLRQGIAGEGITFTSSVMSRATDTSFEAGDAIGVSMYTESGFVGNATNVQYTTADGSGFTSTNPMTWEAAGSAETVDFKGVYPYKADAVADGIYSFTLATGEGASLSDNDVMYSSMTDVTVGAKNVDLTFTHKLVKVVMQVYDQNRNLLPGATVKINNQQTSGALNLADGTVEGTGTADATLNFASNPEVEGEYQTIVMPSAATQGRVITITYNNVDYPCPVDIYAFESGKKVIFSATLNPDGTVSPGETVIVSANVDDWEEEKVNSGWIFGEGESFEIQGKISYQLLSEPAELTIEGSHFGDFRGQLNATDVYSLKYTRTDAANDATITISDKSYTLQEGLTSGTLLIAAGDNTSGIDVSSNDSGIMLTSVLVYTNENIGFPITLWTGDGTAGNGIAGEEGLENAGYRPIMARIKLSDEQLKFFVPGAILRCYFGEGVTEESQAELLWLGTLRMHFNGSLGSFDINSHSLINVVTLSMCDEVAVNNGEMIFEKDWSELSLQLNRIELVPNTDEESNYSNLLWCHMIEQEEIGIVDDGDCWLHYGTLKMGVPASLKSGDIIKVTYVSASEGAYFEGVPEPQGDEAVIFNKQIETEGDGVAEIAVDEDICQRLLELRENREGLGIKSLTIRGDNVAIHKIQLVRGSGE
ncbi:fimbrillin family protein [Bacteroides sp. ET225]|uniref:fimbrillin family protein n=1 Tax=Bacteroides sp. ET225 TaxID=2972461 RepID=UPI0021ACF01E|nr:fimbrillin family protein [Bacteroides sp. ET225]MCR8919083.1 fimbrillin family protein [Bacteroides sp. ET225]